MISDSQSLQDARVRYDAVGANVAQGKPTTQSGTAWGGVSSRAVDANLNTDYKDGGCSHTRMQDNPWLEVDLEASYNVATVRITNRGDEAGTRLDGFTIKVGNEVCGSGLVVPEGETGDFLCDPALIGSTVRVELPGKQRILTVTTLPASAPRLIDVFLNRCASSRSLRLPPPKSQVFFQSKPCSCTCSCL